MQHEDPVLSPIIQKIDQNGVSPQVSNYFINGESLLCHLSKRPSRSPRSNTTRKQVCIPHCLKARILESIHSEYGGHLKFFKTYHRLSENFFWQNMYKDTKNFVRSCTVCLSRKNAFKIPPAPHQPVEQSQEPGETCHIDIFGPLKTTPKGHHDMVVSGALGLVVSRDEPRRETWTAVRDQESVSTRRKEDGTIIVFLLFKTWTVVHDRGVCECSVKGRRDRWNC
ncbi:integrase_H2C2 domain-containing protein [Trichonephila clavipes]|nr:integrase_H2C2 domain-containing protein [Trichonephila clavipes]